MNILLTNDDGIQSEGIRALCRVLGKTHRVLVVAPDGERSACGHSISIMKPLPLEELRLEGAFRAFKFGGTPVDCVKFAFVKREEYGFEPDFVISGINRGSNLGTDTIYSGTVSAAREGVTLGYPSLAVSDIRRKDNDFDAIAAYVCRRLPELAALDHENRLYNINFPDCSASDWRGFVACRTGVNLYDEMFDLVDGNYYLSGQPIPHENAEPCDTDFIRENYITISPLVVDFTDEKGLGELQKKFGEKK